jgi:RNA-directed DNA polymerase
VKAHVRSKRRHQIRTSNDLARHLGVSLDCLKRLLKALDHDESRLYRSWEEPKRSGGTRPIDAPKELLKFVQRRINERLLQRTEISKVAVGGVRGRSLRYNLVPHLRQAMVANFDLKSFFSNITNRQAYILYTKMGLAPDAAKILTRLTSFKGRIPQGAPTSPMLSNLVAGYGGRSCLDGRLEGLCAKNGFQTRRWIDDISLSGSAFLKRFESTVEKIIEQSGFISNEGPRQLRIMRNLLQIVLPAFPARFRSQYLKNVQ